MPINQSRLEETIRTYEYGIKLMQESIAEYKALANKELWRSMIAILEARLDERTKALTLIKALNA